MTFVQVLFLIYIAMIFVTTLLEVVFSLTYDELITPFFIYEDSYMNWFGCWFCFILLSIFSPAMLVIKIIIFIFHDFIYWLFHVGRKDDV